MTDGWTIGATLVAAGTGLFVGWQAYETRQATRTSENAFVASTAMAIDTVRTRLDDQAPQAEVHVTGPFKNPQGVGMGGGASGEWPLDKGTFHFPRDNSLDKSLIVQFTVLVTVHGDRPVQVSCEGDLYVEDGEPTKANSLEIRPTPRQPGGTWDRRVLLRLKRTPGEWAENYQARVDGRPLPHVAHGVIAVADYRDHGVVDSWEVSFEAWPLEPAPNLDGQWQLSWMNHREVAHPQWTQHEEHPLMKRSYWQSRSESVKLPAPTYEAPRRRRLFRKRDNRRSGPAK